MPRSRPRRSPEFVPTAPAATHPLSSRLARAALLLSLVLICWGIPGCARPAPVLRVGVPQYPPFSYRDPEGRLTGFAIAVIREAAGRAGYAVELSPVEAPVIEAIERAEVDLIPMAPASGWGSASVEVTEAWWHGDARLLTRAAPDAGRIGRVLYVANDLSAAAAVWPDTTRMEPAPDFRTALARLCRKEAGAVWLDGRPAAVAMQVPPPECAAVPLRETAAGSVRVAYGVGIHKASHAAGERIAAQLAAMRQEGRAFAIARDWGLVSAAQHHLAEQLSLAYRRNLNGFYGFGAGALLLLAAAWFLARTRLRQQTAQRAAETRSQFLANMSHELRTPMNGVLGLIDLVLATELASEQREQLLLARSSARSLLGILNDILDLTRIDSGSLTLESIPFSLREVSERSARLMAPRAQEKGIEILLDLQPQLPETVQGDPVRLQQVLLNLLGNAVKFTEQGSVKLRVSCGKAHQEHLEVQFQVQDTGIGIPPSKQAAIFEAFTQADGSNTRPYGGSGLGLAISSRLVAAMGGTLTVASELGRGSTFRFSPVFGSPCGAVPYRPPNVLRGKRILIVDDSIPHLELLEFRLSQAKARCTCLRSGRDAVELLETGQRFDLVALDTRLQGEDGFAVAEAVKKLPGGPPILLLLETLDPGGDAARMRSLGLHDAIAKPAEPSEFMSLLARILEPPLPVQLPPLPEPAESHRTLRVLVAEDNRINQLVVKRLLEMGGHHVHLTADGVEALEALEKDRFDVALFDIQMPRMGGLEAVAELRQRERRSGAHLPVVALTAHALKGDRERFLAAGMDEYLAKPVELAELLALLQAVSAGCAQDVNVRRA